MFELHSVPSHESGTPEILSTNDTDSNKQFVNPNDVLISKTNPRLNRTWVVGNVTKHHNIASTEWVGFDSSKHSSSKFLSYVLQTYRIRDYLSHNASGVGGSLTRVKPNIFDDISIGTPPLNEQHRIVTKIEELFSELDKGIESLKTAREQLKVYRQALLKHAFEGKLTEQWRKDTIDKLETADDVQGCTNAAGAGSAGAASLLERIKQEREARYKQQLEDWKAAVKQWEADGKEGKKPAKPKKPGLNLDNIKDLIVALASVYECGFVAQTIDEKLSVVDDQIKGIDLSLSKSEALRQSNSEKSFSGQLVPQDPNDEPASVLLKRIAEEKAEATTKTKKTKVAKKKITRKAN